jgi:glycosyltransferase involved in cell wall biosynthesis
MFSVIVPTFGRPAFLADALESVLAQTFDDFECIVVDDASPESMSVPSDPRVRVVTRETNGGPPAARNTGIAAARGRYVAFLDDDDVWLPHRLADAAAAHYWASVVVCWQATLGDDPDAATGRSLDGDVSDTILDDMIPHLGCTSVEREVIPLFDETYATSEDVEWWLRVSKGAIVSTVKNVGLLYRSHDGPRARTGPAQRIADGQRLLTEHADWFDSHPEAKAFRLKRIGLYALQCNDRAAARKYFRASLRSRREARTAWHLLRTYKPGGPTKDPQESAPTRA